MANANLVFVRNRPNINAVNGSNYPVHHGRFVAAQDYGRLDTSGVSDSSEAVQAAITDAATVGYDVQLPPGTITCTSALAGASDVSIYGAGPNATILQQTTSGVELIRWTDRNYFGLHNMTVKGSDVAAASVYSTTAAHVSYPNFRDLIFSGWGGASTAYAAIDLVSAGGNIYFPDIDRCVFDGASTGTRVGVRMQRPSGIYTTVGATINRSRFTNVQIGIHLKYCDTASGFGNAFDGILSAGSGRGLLFDANGIQSEFRRCRFETGAIDVYVEFAAGSADNVVTGNFGGAGTSVVVDNGTRSQYDGFDGGAVSLPINNCPNPQNFANYIAFGQSAAKPTMRDCFGSPEGAVAAPPGSVCLRRDGGATTSIYVKTSGTGNVGWTAK